MTRIPVSSGYTHNVLDAVIRPRNTASMELAAKIKAIRTQRLKLSQAAFAERLRVSQPTVSRWEKAEDVPTDAQLKKLATILGTTIAELRYGEAATAGGSLVPVVGYVGAGERVFMVDEDISAAFDPVPAPPGTDGEELEAARIRGDSARPFRDGWTVFWRKHTRGVPDDCIGKLCVVKTQNGELYLKEVRRGYKPKRFNLLSFNAAFDPIEDVALAWASPVRAITP